MSLNFKFHYFPGVGGWVGKSKIKANSAQPELELGLSLAIFNKKGVEWYKVSQLYNKEHKKANTSIEHMVSNLCAVSDS